LELNGLAKSSTQAQRASLQFGAQIRVFRRAKPMMISFLFSWSSSAVPGTLGGRMRGILKEASFFDV
jgi:hypothetical protein